MPWTFDSEAPLGSKLRVRKHRLHNGLTLISVADSSAPIIAYQSWFAVGSKHESPGKTGMAHFFEHLMFAEMKSLPMGEFDRKIESIGGETNAATWVDWTYYRASVPSTALEFIVGLEAIRLSELILSPAVVEAEREVVINERLQCIHDDVDGFAGQELFRTAFQSHGYGWPTIGWMEDIRALSIQDMEVFYRDCYAPNNLTLVVVGDVAEDELLAHVEAHYGALQDSGKRPQNGAPEPAQVQERRRRYTKPVSSDRILIGYKAPPQGHADWPVLSFACQLLAGSASAPLHRSLVVGRELASSISCDIMPFRDASLVELSATATRGHSIEELESAIDEELARLIAAPIPASEMEKVANQVETEFWSSLTTVDGKAESLGHFEVVRGDYRALFTMAETLASVTAEDVSRVLRDYFKPERRTVIQISSDQSSSEQGVSEELSEEAP